MWKATSVCVLIGWGFGLLSLVMTGDLRGPYDVVTAFGMGFIMALFGFVVLWAQRKTKTYTTAYITTAVIGGLIVFGGIYAELNPV